MWSPLVQAYTSLLSVAVAEVVPTSKSQLKSLVLYLTKGVCAVSNG